MKMMETVDAKQKIQTNAEKMKSKAKAAAFATRVKDIMEIPEAVCHATVQAKSMRTVHVAVMLQKDG
jgi:hypothetical protein